MQERRSCSYLLPLIIAVICLIDFSASQMLYPIDNIDNQSTRERTMKLGLTHKEQDSNIEEGYIVYSSIYPQDEQHNYVRILNMQGKEVHKWDLGPKRPGLWAYIPDPETTEKYRKGNEKGLLLAISQTPMDEIKEPHKFIAWETDRGGYMQLITFDNQVIWTYKDEYQHHDARLTKDGMIAYIANEMLANPEEVDEIIKIASEHRGINKPKQTPPLYSDVIKIADPLSGEIIFQWRAADHLDPHIDVLNYNDPFDEWNHGNTIVPLYENPENSKELTHLMVSFRQISTIVKIDVKTGNFVRLLHSPFISQQHDCSIVDGDSSRILVFDNRYSPNDFAPSSFSTVVEYNLKENAPFPLFPGLVGPKIEWIYLDGIDFYSSYISGAHRLPNFSLKENGVQYTLITEGMKGRIFIVKTTLSDRIHPLYKRNIMENKIIFEFMNPEIAPGVGKKVILGRSSIFRSRYILPDMFSEEQIAQMTSVANAQNNADHDCNLCQSV